MKRIHTISKCPEFATDTPIEVWLTLLRNVIDAFIPFFTNKDPQNPVPLTPDDDGGET